jgi:Protein of unknown function (DUF1573)
MRRALVAIILLSFAASRADAGAKDYFSEFEKDFGPTPRGPVLVHYFSVSNTTKNAVTIGTPRVSCGCVSAHVMHANLAPGESTVVTAYMDTKRILNLNTTKSVIVYVPFLAPRAEEVTLKVQCVARDDLFLSKAELAMGEVQKGKSTTVTTKVTVTNQAKWEVSDIASTGKFVTGSFKLLKREAAETTYEVSAKLDANCPAGNWTSELFLKTNVAGLERIRVPVTVNVAATAIAATPEAVTIADLKEGSAHETKLELKGVHAFKILAVNGSDAEVGVKAQASDSRATHTLLFTVKPSKTGDLKRSIEVLTDHKDMPKLTIPFEAKVGK